MKTYSSGRNRVHTSSSEANIRGAIEEYDAFVKAKPDLLL